MTVQLPQIVAPPTVLSCPRCGSQRISKRGFSRGKQSYQCGSGHRFTNTERYRAKYSASIVGMAVHLVKQGLGTRDASIRLVQLYSTYISHATIADWCRREGVILDPRKRSKPCAWCGSLTSHKGSCPAFKARLLEPKKEVVVLW